MPVKWKNTKNFNPDIVLSRIESIKTVTNDQKVSYSGIEYHDTMAVLQSMVAFPKKIEGIDRESIISSAVNNIAKNSVLNAKDVLNEINNIVKATLAKKELKYHFLTSLSLGKPYTNKSIRIENANIRLFDSSYPKKYLGKDKKIQKQKQAIGTTPDNYTKVIISLKEKSNSAASTKALRVLDIQRAIWCLFANSVMEFDFGGKDWEPINKIRLGRHHTLHKDNGELATEIFWYEPNFQA